MHDPLGIVDEMMDLTFQNRLKILLHLSSSHFRDNGKRELRRGLNAVQLRADHFNPSVLDLIHVPGGDPFYRMSSSSAALQIDIFSPDPLPSKAGP